MSHPNADRVAAAARAAGLDVEVREFPDGTRTAEEAARSIGVEVGQIVKSLVFGVDDDVVVALVSGDRQLDEALLSAAAGGGAVGRVDADRVRAATGYPIGGVPPLGHATELRIFVDRDLSRFDELWAAAGTPRHAFRVGFDALVRASGGSVVDLARRVG